LSASRYLFFTALRTLLSVAVLFALSAYTSDSCACRLFASIEAGKKGVINEADEACRFSYPKEIESASGVEECAYMYRRGQGAPPVDARGLRLPAPTEAAKDSAGSRRKKWG